MGSLVEVWESLQASYHESVHKNGGKIRPVCELLRFALRSKEAQVRGSTLYRAALNNCPHPSRCSRPGLVVCLLSLAHRLSVSRLHPRLLAGSKGHGEKAGL